jgi:acetate kinase
MNTPQPDGPPAECLLTINCGSSSLKFGLFTQRDSSARISGTLGGIGEPEGRLSVRTSLARDIKIERCELPDHETALTFLLDFLQTHFGFLSISAVGHRLVHGGPNLRQPVRIDHAVLDELRSLTPLAPNHLPSEIQAIELFQRLRPAIPQIACFDTAFHATLPPAARRYPLTNALHEAGIVRYGFHGLSYQSIMEQLREIDPEVARGGRVVIAHLGNGSSMAAIRAGECVDTTMGFTPLGGLMMGTRPGDLDPGVLLYLIRERGFTLAQLEVLFAERSGLLGVSGTTSDVRWLLAQRGDDPRAAEALELYTYIARKHLGALAAVLGGLDCLVFTAGIGENAPAIRASICAGLHHLGIDLDPERNRASAPLISAGASSARVRVIPTDEERQIARQTLAVLKAADGRPEEPSGAPLP